MVNDNNATATTNLPAPIEVLRAALPGLGYTLSTDTDVIWNALYDRQARKWSTGVLRTTARRSPTRGEMRAVVEAWIVSTRTKLAAHVASEGVL